MKVLETDADAEDEVSEHGQAGTEPGTPSQDSGERVQADEFMKEFLSAEEPPAKDPREESRETQTTPAPAKSRKSISAPSGPAAYALSRRRLLSNFQEPNSIHFKDHKKFFRMSDHGQKHLGAVLNKAIWRSDMDVVLLELMRRRAVEGLCRAAQAVETSGRKYIIKCQLWTDAKDLKHRGCLLYLGPPEGASSDQAPEFAPPILSTVYVGPSRFMQTIPVHNLRELLGEEHLSRLRRKSRLFRDGSLFMLGRRATVELQMALWKLQGYLLQDKPKDTEEAEPSSE